MKSITNTKAQPGYFFRPFACALLCALAALLGPADTHAASALGAATATVLPPPSTQMRDLATAQVVDENGVTYLLNSDQRFRLATRTHEVIREVISSQEDGRPIGFIKLLVNWE